MEGDELAQSQERVRRELASIEAKTRRLLDNVSPASRAVVERRLVELEDERQKLIARTESLERLGMSGAVVSEVVQETTGFISQLEHTVRAGDLQARQVAMRRCVRQIQLDFRKPAVEVELFEIPAMSAGHHAPKFRSVPIALDN